MVTYPHKSKRNIHMKNNFYKFLTLVNHLNKKKTANYLISGQ